MGFLDDAPAGSTCGQSADYRIVSFRQSCQTWRATRNRPSCGAFAIPKGDRARATLIPGSPESTLVFFVNDRLDRGENFAEWAQAMARADAVRQELLEQGWNGRGLTPQALRGPSSSARSSSSIGGSPGRVPLPACKPTR